MRQHIPYLSLQDGRWYWKPGAALRARGFKTTALGADEAAAIEAARRLNARAADRQAEGRASAPGTLAALLAAYKTSRFFRALAPRTRADYDHYLGLIERWAGDAKVAAITAPMVEDLYTARLAESRSVANYLMRVGRLVWGVAPQLGFAVTGNPFAGKRLVGTDPAANPWPRAAVSAFVAKADALGHHGIGDAVALNHWLGQRLGDVIRLPKSMLGAATLPIPQRKTGQWVILPLDQVPALRARLAEIAERMAEPKVESLTAIADRAGRPYDERGFKRDFAAVRAALASDTPAWATNYVVHRPGARAAEASLAIATTDLQFKNLRHSAVIALIEAGCTHDQVAAITGHTAGSIGTIIETYRRHTAATAASAFQARVAHEQKGSVG